MVRYLHPSFDDSNGHSPSADNLSSLSALITALADLDELCATIENAYVGDLKEGKYERWDERS
jgi:DNA-directed RNA polymerase I and III subunit RPAC2